MSKCIFLIISTLFVVGCASRGYDNLVQEVPELFGKFDAKKYERRETPKNILYLAKTLPKEQKEKSEFYEEEYNLKKQPNSYHYYVPKNREPSSLQNSEIFVDWPKIHTRLPGRENALLIE